MKELFIKYFLKLMFLHENIMDKKVQYILLVFVGLWFVCCFLRFTSSIIFSKIIPLIFALCMLVFSILSLISFQWVYWMMWLIMAWGILITEDIHMHRKKEDEMKKIKQSEFIWNCKCDVLEKQKTDLEIYNKLYSDIKKYILSYIICLFSYDIKHKIKLLLNLNETKNFIKIN